jgi:endonuclease YncB( thermonuclease family)
MARSRAWRRRAAQAVLALATVAPAAHHFAFSSDRPRPRPPVAAAGEVVSGPARVIDGDTIEVAGVRVRLFGIDAPEHRQACGAAESAWACGDAAAAHLEDLVVPGVRCVGHEHDRYGRLVATCDANGSDLGEQMVAAGFAWAFVRYSDAYVATEAEARGRHAGLWRGPAEAPWDFRSAGFVAAAGRRADPAPAADPAATLEAPEGCAIKGNIGSGGRRIYHLPGEASYARTRIDTARGERWFCDAAAAEAAGFRPVQSADPSK